MGKGAVTSPGSCKGRGVVGDLDLCLSAPSLLAQRPVKLRLALGSGRGPGDGAPSTTGGDAALRMCKPPLLSREPQCFVLDF